MGFCSPRRPIIRHISNDSLGIYHSNIEKNPKETTGLGSRLGASGLGRAGCWWLEAMGPGDGHPRCTW